MRMRDDFVMVTKHKVAESVSPGGIIMPNVANEQSDHLTEIGILLAAGPNCKWDIPLGSKVVYPPMEDTPLEIDGKTVHVFKEHYLRAVINE